MSSRAESSLRSPGLALPRKIAFCTLLAAGACGSSNETSGHDPTKATVASIDRFSAQAGMLQVRTPTNGLPEANAPIDFDQGPFITQGLGPAGQVVKYYNFDVKPTVAAPIYAFFAAGSSTPIAGQLNVIDVLPGEPGYNDFWQVMKVTVPSGYVANAAASLADIQAAGYPIVATDMIVNCPVVPAGSTATLRLGNADAGLTRGWYRGQLVHYFNFTEATLTNASGAVPVAPIYVTFNINPGQTGGGPPSGFETETASMQTHNVVAALPGDSGYSPLWAVRIYDDSAFASVSNLTTAMGAASIAAGPLVNCPIVSVP